jgi:outer membrane cobalamin receptor
MQFFIYRLGAAAAALAVSTSALAQTLPSNLATTATSTVSAQTTRESSVAELKLGPTPQLATIVVTPGRTAEALSDTLGDNSVIGRDELDERYLS